MLTSRKPCTAQTAHQRHVAAGLRLISCSPIYCDGPHVRQGFHRLIMMAAVRAMAIAGDQQAHGNAIPDTKKIIMRYEVLDAEDMSTHHARSYA